MTSSGRLPGGSAQVAQRLTPYRRDDSAGTAGCCRQTRVASHGVSGQHLPSLSKQGVFAQGFADDGVVLIIGKVLNTMYEIMHRMLRGVEKWCIDR